MQHCPTPEPDRHHALDLACGKGRHSFWLADQGWNVTAIDRDLSQTVTNTKHAIKWIEADLEAGDWPLGQQQFDLVLVVNYLHRPLFDDLRNAVKPGGVLIYETFMVGNEAYGRPRSPDFLLLPDELISIFDDWMLITHQQGPVRSGKGAEITAIQQSLVAQKPSQH
jgi:SAM-dependent methyltransferase